MAEYQVDYTTHYNDYYAKMLSAKTFAKQLLPKKLYYLLVYLYRRILFHLPRILSGKPAGRWFQAKKEVIFIAGCSENSIQRLSHYLDDLKPFKGYWFRRASRVVIASSEYEEKSNKYFDGIPHFNIDHKTKHDDGWQYHRLLTSFSDAELLDREQESRNRFENVLNSAIKKHRSGDSFVFGTGPSLCKAIDKKWAPGLRVVCNTIVKDPKLWHHINPDILVAGDAIYHFGFTQYAQTFQKDAIARLKESNTYFIYPAIYDPYVRVRFKAVSEKLIPIKQANCVNVHNVLKEQFRLPVLGNVLGLLLLPVACAFGKKIHLWGFDGRAPNDKLFWSNSLQHSYSNLIPTLEDAHPAFFSHYTGGKDPNKYVNDVHGETLDRALMRAEESGYLFKMLHDTTNPSLLKRLSLTHTNND